MPKITMKVEGYQCNKCKNKWIPRNKKEKPEVCPKCGSTRWDR